MKKCYVGFVDYDGRDICIVFENEDDAQNWVDETSFSNYTTVEFKKESVGYKLYPYGK